MKKLALLLVLVMVASLGLVGCGPEQAQEQKNDENNAGVDFSKVVQVRGSDTMVNLGQQWAEKFMDEHPEAQIAVTGGGSGTGIAAIINGTADIAQSSRKMKDSELEQAKANGFELKEFVPGLDGIAIVVNKDNGVDTLTMEDLKAIFTGEKTNWKDFGGKDAPITLYSRESNSGTYAFFKEFVLNDEEYAQSSNLMPSTQAIVEAVKQDANGIGYIGLGYLNDEVKAIKVSKDSNSEAFLPSLETIKSGQYPVARELFIYTAGEPTGVVKMYVDFMMGPEGQKVVQDLKFIPVK
ncbi:phosphate ABC transporter substrate-binding protein [Alkalithermobacter paradoxus]|uniref:Phosphate-binding protein n=1 Tax=Alkalithermobacter paradoxus TaxID=29349 RepID=A0A1V4I607_9FIRM|nr:phosphate-binding protein PstS 1 precursor [[Clostridium] thermoalcaliphilum]